MPAPVDPGEDFSAVTDDLESVIVQNIDRDTGTILEAASGVDALRGASAKSEEGGQPSERLTWTLRASQVPFALKEGGRITDSTGIRWVIGGVKKEGLGKLLVCEDAVRGRG